MSVRVMAAVWELDLPAFEKLVLLALADCANDEGLAWPSIATLRRKTNAGERTVQRSLRALEASGLLTRQEVPGKGCKYHLNPRQTDTPARKSPAPESAQTPATVAPKPSRTITIGLADAKPKRAKPAADLPDWMPGQQWQAYLAMRKAKKAAPTPDAVKLLIAKLERWRAQGHDPGAILDASTENNWTGLFEPKEPANGRSNLRAQDVRGSVRGSRPNPALDMVLEAEREEREAQAFHQGSGSDWPPRFALSAR